MQIRQADRFPGLGPNAAEIRSAQPPAFRADEDQAVVPVFGEALKVPAQLRGDLLRERDRAATGPRLRVVIDQLAAVRLRCGPHHPDGAGRQVQLTSAQPGQLPEPQVGEGGEQHQRPVTRPDLIKAAARAPPLSSRRTTAQATPVISGRGSLVCLV
jgi:hypothetical protein